ncbi:MAG TPA: cache domain-containing protein [Anaeromyxobacter sp.]|nr:cache domain-containing protein [Anaeromyxobacter sp.]
MPKIAALALAILAIPLAARAEERASTRDAELMVHKAVEFYKKVGREKALAAFSDPKGAFTYRDIYITAFDFEGKCLAHGANASRVGKNFIHETDVDGKNWHVERIKIAKEKGKGWVEYKFPNPAKGGEVEQKVAYFEAIDGVILTCGAYRP